jgi:hypothetical protein
VKHCHGYLLHELLGATARPGRYGGPLDRRTPVPAPRWWTRSAPPAPGLGRGRTPLGLRHLPSTVPGPTVGARPVEAPDRPRPFGGRRPAWRPRAHRGPRRARPVPGAGHRPGVRDRRQPVLQPPHPATGVLPALGRVRSPPRTRSSTWPACWRSPPSSAHEHPDVAVVGSGYSYLQDHAGPRGPGRGPPRRRRLHRTRAHGALVPDAAGRRARRRPLDRRACVPHLQRLHHRTPTRAGVGVLSRSTTSTRTAPNASSWRPSSAGPAPTSARPDRRFPRPVSALVDGSTRSPARQPTASMWETQR